MTGSATAMAELLPRGHSGVRFVVVAAISVLLIWAACIWPSATGGRSIANERVMG